MRVETRQAVDPVRAKSLDTEGLRQAFLAETLFQAGEIRLVYSHYERLVVGGVVPSAGPLTLSSAKETGTAGFLDRREMAALNIGGPGRITVGGSTYEVGPRDVLYMGMGAGEVTFESADTGTPARFYLVSTPAHTSYPVKLLKIADARKLDLGKAETSNVRSIYQMVHPDVCQSCQLVLGVTELAAGSVWNTMPPHVHDRRSEVYLYFDLAPGSKVIHLMGEPTETRHLVVGESEVILSPPWSIHCGAGTGAYTFCWAMGGDNIDYTDMDAVSLEVLK
ncbi:5-dehydro-4-deoxy-D-glucuronate isomerase [Chthonobacter rhizosphaerae]|uniref:5-dehydro-4-deoxy-D-glucuronate isomerase n=1 Tax=Chthonobacter rhizosphaerae TaxID=2735553 RepID=UPI0015EEE036|nr:5-dehydro-4-deoxy-D-glucuronate isomerase [Chthonobacter rhizosphaerae]